MATFKEATMYTDILVIQADFLWSVKIDLCRTTNGVLFSKKNVKTNLSSKYIDIPMPSS